MPITRSQAHGAKPPSTKKPVSKKPASKRQPAEEKTAVGGKRKVEDVDSGEKDGSEPGLPPEKKVKEESSEMKTNGDHPAKHMFQSGLFPSTITDRGRLMFLRKVQSNEDTSTSSTAPVSNLKKCTLSMTSNASTFSSCPGLPSSVPVLLARQPTPTMKET